MKIQEEIVYLKAVRRVLMKYRSDTTSFTMVDSEPIDTYHMCNIFELLIRKDSVYFAGVEVFKNLRFYKEVEKSKYYKGTLLSRLNDDGNYIRTREEMRDYKIKLLTQFIAVLHKEIVENVDRTLNQLRRIRKALNDKSNGLYLCNIYENIYGHSLSLAQPKFYAHLKSLSTWDDGLLRSAIIMELYGIDKHSLNINLIENIVREYRKHVINNYILVLLGEKPLEINKQLEI